MTLEDRARRLVARYRTHPQSSARTLLVTIFGDTVEPRGSAIWLGSLARLAAPLGVNDRLVRTSLNRLVRDGLLEARRDGRRSHYRVTAASRPDFAAAEQRIYHGPPATWDGQWTIVAVTDETANAAVARRLGWLGFRPVGRGVHVSPAEHADQLPSLLREARAKGRVVVFRAANGQVEGAMSDRDLASASFAVAAVGAMHRSFLRQFTPLADASAEGLAPESAFLVRTLLVDAFRRIVLREPDLPRPLWPEDWVGDRTRHVAGHLYRAVTDAADVHVDGVAEGPNGPLPPPGPWTTSRFAD